MDKRVDFCPRCGMELRVKERKGNAIHLTCRNPKCAGYENTRKEENS